MSDLGVWGRDKAFAIVTANLYKTLSIKSWLDCTLYTQFEF
jgi:hypothetical protein